MSHMHSRLIGRKYTIYVQNPDLAISIDVRRIKGIGALMAEENRYHMY